METLLVRCVGMEVPNGASASGSRTNGNLSSIEVSIREVLSWRFRIRKSN